VTFGELPIGARFVMADSPKSDVKVKTGYQRWKWEGHRGYLMVAIGSRADREVIRLEAKPCSTA
jgi:anti-sigma factor ChrR (cupin superfamily)